MAEFLVAHFIEPLNSEEPIHGSLPLHMTAMHWFESIEGPARIEDAISGSEAIKSLGAISTVATEADLFDDRNGVRNVPVMRLEKTEKLTRLHKGLLAVIQPLAIAINEKYTGENWNPHVTDTRDTQLLPGDPVTVDSLTVVGRMNNSREKVALFTTKLR